MNTILPYLKYKNLSFTLNTLCTDEVDKSVTEVINSVTTNVDQSYFISNYGYQQEQRLETQKIIVAMLSIIVLIFSISLSIINNTITANIRNSRRKIGTLRAVGAGEGDLVKSYMLQLLSMLLWGVAIGIALFIGSFAVIYAICKVKGYTLSMTFNPLGVIVFCIVVIVICSINLWLKIRKEMKNSIVANIREL